MINDNDHDRKQGRPEEQPKTLSREELMAWLRANPRFREVKSFGQGFVIGGQSGLQPNKEGKSP
jgi:hypothetical protein